MSKIKSRLGRGLSSLMTSPVLAETHAHETSDGADVAPLPDSADTIASAPICTLSLDQIIPNPHQPRKKFDEAALADLARSIQVNGLIQPVLVKPTDAGGYELITGERRWRAAKVAGLTDIPAIVRHVDPLNQAQLALIENVQREDLNAIDRASAYQFLMKQLGMTQNDLATRLGEERSTIANFLRLLDLIPPVRDMVGDGRLSASHAKLLATLSPEDQQRLADIAVGQGLSVRSLERLIQTPNHSTPPPAKPALSAHLQELERSITRQMGLRSQIRSGAKGKGRLILHYTSLDQFDTLLERLGIKIEE